MLSGQRVTEFSRLSDPVTVRRVTGIAQRAVHQCYVVLILCQYGNRDTVAPVQIASLAANVEVRLRPGFCKEEVV